MTGTDDPGTEMAGAHSPEQASIRSVWFKERALGLIALVPVAAAYVTALLLYLFAPPDDPALVLDAFERHWTDDLDDWYWRLSAIGAGLALCGLVIDKRRDIAAIALGLAVFAFLWPWGD